MSRREARERALGLLYEAENKGIAVPALVAELPADPDPFALDVAMGVAEHGERIDELISRYAQGWELDRMPVLDRAILRMATFELLERPDVPTGAILSEAVEIAARYSTDESSRFVNGVLAAIAGEVRPGGPSSLL